MNSIILMADIIHSRELDGSNLIANFRQLTDYLNTKFKNEILSPLTITLGDEFQGITKNEDSALEIIIASEEFLVKNSMNFKLRYVVNEGEIETEINKNKAYEMLGNGLTEARERLITNKHNSKRFHISLKNNSKSNYLNKVFQIYQFLVDRWKIKDLEVVTSFLDGKDYKDLALEMNMYKSSLWRREKSLAMNEYRSTKDLIFSYWK